MGSPKVSQITRFERDRDRGRDGETKKKKRERERLIEGRERRMDRYR